MKYTVHAGHNPDGKPGCGAVGQNGKFKESTQNRIVAEKVIALLKAQGHAVIDCTVNDGKDAHDVLEKITAKCNAAAADLNISIHHNAGSKDPDSKTTGTEVMVYSTTSKAVAPAKRVVDAIAKLGFTNRGIVIRPDLYVLKHTTKPTILVECCFVDDKDDVKLYNPDKMAAAIVEGVLGADFKPEISNYTAICGKAQATVAQMQAYLRKVNPAVPTSVLSMLPLYISEGEAEGIRGDVAFAQSCLETGNFAFKPSDTAVTLAQNNFCGMGVTSYGKKGNSFSTPQLGIRAQVQHLKAYANKEVLTKTCVDPRFALVSRGVAPYVEWLGAKENPKGSGWAEGADYGAKILRILSAVCATEAEKSADPVPAYDGMYRVRYTKNGEQKGAFTVLANAQKCCKENPGYMIFTDAGIPVGPLPLYITSDKTFTYYTSTDGKTKAGSAMKGKYTIVDVDAASGYGRLKSGAGWVNMAGMEVSLFAQNFRNLVADEADVVYGEIVELGCTHATGSKCLEDIRKTKKTTCNASVSSTTQRAGISKTGKIVGHTPKDGQGGKTKTTPAKAIKGIEYLIPGTYDIVEVRQKYDDMPAPLKDAGIIYVQDSNECISAGGGYIRSTNEGSGQMKNGKYVNTKVKSGYPFTSPILYAIVPRR